MKLGKYISFSLLFLYSISSYAQLSSIDLKKLKLNALEITLRYESSAANSNDDQRDDFIKLFESDEIQILNDVLPDNNLDSKIEVKNYIDLIPTFFKNSIKIRFIPYNVIVNETSAQNGIIEVSGIKFISGKEEKSQVYYSDSIDITISLKYNLSTKSIKIIGISLNETPSKYIIVKAQQKKLFISKPIIKDTLIINRLRYITDENGNVLIKNIDINQSISVKSNSEYLNGVTNFNNIDINNAIKSYTSKNILIVPFHYSFIELSPYCGLIPWKKSPVLYESAINKNISSYEAGLNLSIKLFQKTKGYWKLVTGISNFKYHYENSIKQIQYTYQSTDPDGYTYFRNNEIQNYKENTQLNGYSIPILIEKDIFLNKKWGYYIQSGLIYNKIYKNNSTSSAISQYSGLYPDFFNIEIKENGVYDFGYYEMSNSQTLYTTKYFSSLLIGAGFFCKWTKKINITTGLTYKQNLSNIFLKDSKMLSSNSNELNNLNSIGINSALKVFTLNFGIQYKL